MSARFIVVSATYSRSIHPVSDKTHLDRCLWQRRLPPHLPLNVFPHSLRLSYVDLGSIEVRICWVVVAVRANGDDDEGGGGGDKEEPP